MKYKQPLYWIKLSIFVLLTLALVFYYFTYKFKRENISIFPMQNYSQNVSHWIKPTDKDYDQPLLTEKQQALRHAEWYDHYYGKYSPWNKNFIEEIFSVSAPNDLKSQIQKKIQAFDNRYQPENEIGFGANYQPYENQWIERLTQQININQFDVNRYNPAKRAIAIDNIEGRQLPTNEVHFYNHTIAGQGYPFDNLQASVIWAGTPLYILGETESRDWFLVLAPSFMAWVQNRDVAFVDDAFIKTWQQQAQHNLIAIVKTKIPIIDSENNLHRFAAYIGMVFPGEDNNHQFKMLIPVSDDKHQAHIYYAILAEDQGVNMPLLATPHHFSNLIKELIGRTYGWGSMYFYNDCASELKNLYTPFGIWLPIHSSSQVNPEKYRIKQIDLSNENVSARLDYLKKYGHKFMTIVYIGGHVFLYVGTFQNPHDPHQLMAVSYQNVWGFKPKNASPEQDSRIIIGKAVFLPILEKYPEDATLASLADKKYFQLAYLDQLEEETNTSSYSINIGSLLSP